MRHFPILKIVAIVAARELRELVNLSQIPSAFAVLGHIGCNVTSNSTTSHQYTNIGHLLIF